MPRLQVRGYYWLEGQLSKNLGDCLGAIVLDALGYQHVARGSRGRWVVNPGRCLLSVGSVVCDSVFERIKGPIDVWGAGWRGERLSPGAVERVRFLAVRGPRTVAGLGLPADTPVGDPVLLLPQLRPGTVKHHGRALIVPHFHRIDQMSNARRRRLTGCDELLSVRVLGMPVPGLPLSPRRMVGLVIYWARLKCPLRTARNAIDRIAGAGFVLTGSLHGAILAQVYDVPWAAYDDGYVDVPEKWYDWGAYLGIDVAFVGDVKAGMEWWRTAGRHGRIRDTRPLLAAFPYRCADRAFEESGEGDPPGCSNRRGSGDSIAQCRQ